MFICRSRLRIANLAWCLWTSVERVGCGVKSRCVRSFTLSNPLPLVCHPTCDVVLCQRATLTRKPRALEVCILCRMPQMSPASTPARCWSYCWCLMQTTNMSSSEAARQWPIGVTHEGGSQREQTDACAIFWWRSWSTVRAQEHLCVTGLLLSQTVAFL